jgi:DNA-binding transcriptional LysR family regulator
MSSSRVKLFLSVSLAALVLLAGCRPEIQPAPPLTTPVVWQVQVTPALRWLEPIFQKCAAELPGTHLVVSEQSVLHMDPQKADFLFQWGQSANLPFFVAVIAQDELVVVVNPLNPLNSLTATEVQSLFAGKTDSWSLVLKARCASCGPDFEGAVKAYGYAAGEDVQQAAIWIQPGPAMFLAPDPQAVREAVARERYSIGFLPARWLDKTVKSVKIEGSDLWQLKRPVLGLISKGTNIEVPDPKREWLSCVTESSQ